MYFRRPLGCPEFERRPQTWVRKLAGVGGCCGNPPEKRLHPFDVGICIHIPPTKSDPQCTTPSKMGQVLMIAQASVPDQDPFIFQEGGFLALFDGLLLNLGREAAGWPEFGEDSRWSVH